MKATVIVIGDELLIGQVTDTNSGFIARTIAPAGWELASVITVHDNADDITGAIDRAFAESDVVLTTGGLGPTKDDITKATLCRYFGGEMVHDPSVLANIRNVFARRGITLNPLTEGQAMVPSSCRVIQNSVGTAPVMWFERPDGKILVSMPGVPFETVKAFEESVFPQLLQRFHSDEHIEHRTLVVAGLTESAVAMQLDLWEQQLPGWLHLAYLPKPGIIRLRLDGHHTDPSLLWQTIEKKHAELCRLFKSNLLADSDMTPAEALIVKLRANGYRVATAESCTGGNIAHSITMIAGCSDVYNGSVVSYSNDAKMGLLGVSGVTLADHGAVSAETAYEMAYGAARTTCSDCAIATTGIAGPGGGSEYKPVGTVWIAILYPAGTPAPRTLELLGGVEYSEHHTPDGATVQTARFRLPGDRGRVIDRASTIGLTALALTI